MSRALNHASSLGRLRPATAPGEDRNMHHASDKSWEAKSLRPATRRARIATPPTAGWIGGLAAAPGHRAGRGSQRSAGSTSARSRCRLRPAIKRGEDRNCGPTFDRTKKD